MRGISDDHPDLGNQPAPADAALSAAAEFLQREIDAIDGVLYGIGEQQAHLESQLTELRQRRYHQELLRAELVQLLRKAGTP